MPKSRKILLVIFGVVLLAGIGFHLWRYDGQFSIQSGPPLPRAEGSFDDAHLEPFKVPPTDPFGFPSVSIDKLQLLRWLRAGEFGQLDQLINRELQNADSDFRLEANMAAIYWCFRDGDPQLDALFDRWRKRFPDSNAMRIAHGAHLVSRAWVARGEKWIGETAAGNIERMERYSRAAMSEAAAVRANSPGNVAAYYLMLDAMHFYGWSAQSEAVLAEGLSHHPESYALRKMAFATVEPLWGGSYERMAGLAREAQAYVASNPRLAVLLGEVDADKADKSLRRGDIRMAVDLYNKALAYGPDQSFLAGRADAYLRAADASRALNDYTLALRMAPQAQRFLKGRASIMDLLGRFTAPDVARKLYDRAREHLEVAHEIDPLDPTIAPQLRSLDERIQKLRTK